MAASNNTWVWNFGSPFRTGSASAQNMGGLCASWGRSWKGCAARQADFNEANSHKVELTPGLQDYYVELKDVGPHLRLDIGDRAGKYVIPSFEIGEV